MRLWILAFAVLVLTSCVGTRESRREARELRRCDRYAKKHPTCFQADTIHDTVLVIIPGDTIETAVVLTLGDTVYLDTGRLHVRIIRVPTGSPCDTADLRASILAKCDSAVKYVPVATVCPPRPKCQEGLVHQGWKWAAISMGVLLLLLILLGWFLRQARG
jgi:hypothetical protein